LARSYIRRRRHHPSLFMWCGGNEFVLPDIARGSESILAANKENLMDYLAAVVAEEDPGRRFLRTSPSGPRFFAIMPDFGKGEHWDVHGPWIISREPEFDLEDYWENDDALFRSEAGAPSASPVDLLERYRGPFNLWPPTAENPYWRRSPFWIEWHDFVRENPAAKTATIGEFVAWSQARQARALSLAASSCKNRFPRCGGFIVWMGHDCFPCTANTSIVDFDGRPKPAAIALRKVFQRQP
jgi:beta-mannosidase